MLKALASALLPVVRVFQMGGFGVGEFEVAAHLAFVQAAAVLGRTKGGRTNVSRIAAMTGLTRKEVRHLLQILQVNSKLIPPTTSRQRTARVLEAWRTDPLYLDDRGRPRLLTVDGDEPSFRSLARSYAGDVTPISVLRELERTGAVRMVGEGQVRCRTSSTASAPADSAFLQEFAQRLQDFATAMAAAAEPGDNAVYYGLRQTQIAPPDLAHLFRTTFAERGASLLDGADRWLASRQRQRRSRATAVADPPVEVRLGVFLSASKPGGTRDGAPSKPPSKRAGGAGAGRRAQRSAR
ncbi:MAG: hypothetical protein IT480_04240 [Gammaproteobacteria bacterium]|nr:hypothetical protein [Gammaproteobacteria bacterium]